MKLKLNAEEIVRVKKITGCDTDVEFAERVGLSRMTLHRATRGDGFNSATLAALVEAGARIQKLVVPCG